MKENLDEVLELIKEGKISIRKASEKYGYDRDFLKRHLVKKYGQTEEGKKEIEARMKANKNHGEDVEVDPKLLESVFLRTMNGEIDIEQARTELGEIDIETLQSWFLNFVKGSDDGKMIERYRDYKESSKSKTNGINFRLVAVQMIYGRVSQSDMAKELGISPRTISREFEKFKDDEDTALYDIVKFYSDKKMRGQKLTRKEEIRMILGLNSYRRRHPELLDPNRTEESEKIEKMKAIVSEAERLSKEEGLTQAEIAKRLGISTSGLRRAKKFCEEQQMLEESKKTTPNGKKTAPTSPNDDGDRED